MILRVYPAKTRTSLGLQRSFCGLNSLTKNLFKIKFQNNSTFLVPSKRLYCMSVLFSHVKDYIFDVLNCDEGRNYVSEVEKFGITDVTYDDAGVMYFRV